MQIRFGFDTVDGGYNNFAGWLIDDATVQGVPVVPPPDTTAPAAPSGLDATPGDGNVDLLWNANTESDLAGYNVYRKDNGGPYVQINGPLINDPGYPDTGLTNDTMYYYVVQAVDTSNNPSPDSNEGSAMPAAPSSNTAPTAASSAVSTDEDVSLLVTLSGTDPEDCELTFTIVNLPANGSLSGVTDQLCTAGTPNSDGAQVTYTPNADYDQTDTFTYKVNDGGTVDSNTATVTITVNPVNDPPVAGNDSYSTDEDVALNVVAPGVLFNDTDADGDLLTPMLVGGPANGVLSLNGNGSFTYTPAVNSNGTDSFTYKVNDGSVDSNTATVTITVNPVNDPPLAGDDSYNTYEDVALNVVAPGVLFNDTDADGDLLTPMLVGGPANGVLTLNGNGSFTYTPAVDSNGTDSFTYKVNDGGTVDSNTATVTITVNPVNDPPVAADDSASVATGGTVTLLDTGQTSLLANDLDPEGESLLVTTIPVSGPSSGTLILQTDGTFSYTHDGSATSSDSFVYEACDPLGLCDTATVSITVDAVTSPTIETVHVADLDGASTRYTKGRWSAQVTVTILNSSGGLVGGATVSGIFTQNGSGPIYGNCVTVNWICVIDSGEFPKNKGSATFVVDSVTPTTLNYDAAANDDPDGDSNGTTIALSK